jgi:hypothetical protein
MQLSAVDLDRLGRMPSSLPCGALSRHAMRTVGIRLLRRHDTAVVDLSGGWSRVPQSPQSERHGLQSVFSEDLSYFLSKLVAGVIDNG